MEIARSEHGRVLDDERGGSGDGNDEPDQGRESKTAERTKLKPKSIGRAEVVDDGKGKDEDDGGNRGQRDEGDVNCAVQLLPRTAVGAFGKVRLIVATHLRREASDVIAPPSKDVADEWIDALTHINL